MFQYRVLPVSHKVAFCLESRSPVAFTKTSKESVESQVGRRRRSVGRLVGLTDDEDITTRTDELNTERKTCRTEPEAYKYI